MRLSLMLLFILTMPAGAEGISVRREIIPFGVPDLASVMDIPGEFLDKAELLECIRQFDGLQRIRSESNLEFAELVLDETIETLKEESPAPTKNEEPKDDLDRKIDEIERSLESQGNNPEKKIERYLRKRQALEIATISFGEQCALKRYRVEDVKALAVAANP